MKRKNNTLILAIISSFCLFGFISCIEEIDLKVPSGLSDNVVIQGKLVMGEQPRIEVLVSRLFDFSADSRENLNVREVILMDDNNNELKLDPVFPGVYNTSISNASGIEIAHGVSYKLRVSTFDGRTFESSFELLNRNTAPESLEMKIVQEYESNNIGVQSLVDRIQLGINTIIHPESSGLYWEIENTYKITDSPIDAGVQMKICYITKSANASTLPVVNKKNLISAELRNFPLIVQPIDFRMAEGMYFEVRQYSLSEGAAEYWENASLLVEREGGLFEDPVGLIQSNFENINDPSEDVYGYFFASEEKMIRIKVPLELSGEMNPHCPPPPRPSPGPGCNLGICCDCLLDSDATVIRPHYWID